MANMNGLIPTTQVASSGNSDSTYFVLKGSPTYIETIACDTLTANTIASGSLELNGGALTTTEDGTVLTLNGVPVGSEGIISITGDAPIAVSVGQNPVVSLNDSTVVPGSYTLASITVDSKGLITEATNGTIPANDDWSNFPAQSDVDMNGYQLDNVSKIVGDTSLTFSAATDITVDPLFGNFICNSKNVVLRANAPAGQEVSDSALTIETDNDMTLTATDALSITAGTMIINNAVDMASHKITSVADPTVAQDAATKNYVDGLDAQDVKLTGAQSISGIKTFTTLPETSIGATLPSQFVNKAYVDAITPPTPGLGTVLNVSNVASKDIDMNGFDIASVNDITMNGLVPTITGSNIAGNMVISAANTMNIATVGTMTLAAGGIMSIGGATYTTLENLNIDNSVIQKETGTDDLTIRDVGAIFMGGSGAINFVDEATITGTGLKVLSIADAGATPYTSVLGYDAVSGTVKYQPASATPGLADVLAVSNLTGGTTIDSSTGVVLANELDVATIKALGFPLNTDVGIEANVVFPNDAAINFQGLGTITSGTSLEINAGAGEDVIQFKSYTDFQKGITMTGAFPLEVKNGTGIAGWVLKTNGAGDAPEWVDVGSVGTITSVLGGTNISVDSTVPTEPVVSVDIKEALDMKTNAITNASSLGFSATQSIAQNTSNSGLLYSVPSGGMHDFRINNNSIGTINSSGMSATNITASQALTASVIRPVNNASVFAITATKLVGGTIPLSINASAGIQLAGNFGTAGQYLKSNGAAQPTWESLPNAGGQVNSITAGSNISVDSTDPANPTVAVAISSTLDMNNQSITELKDITMNNGATITNNPANNLSLKASPTALSDIQLTPNAVRTTGFLEAAGNGLKTDSVFPLTPNATDNTITVYNAAVALQNRLKVGISADPGTAGQVLTSTGNGLEWTTIAAGGVQSVSGVGNIAVDDSIPSAPVVSFDVIEDILMNGSNITNANITETNQLHGVNGQALVLRSYNQDIQLEAGEAGGFNINLVDAVKCSTSLELGNGSQSVPLLLDGDVGTTTKWLRSNGAGLTPAWAELPDTPTPSLAQVIAVDNTAGGNIVMTGYNIIEANTVETGTVASLAGSSLILNAQTDIILNPLGAESVIFAEKKIVASEGIDLTGLTSPLYAEANASQRAGDVGQYLASQGAGATPKWTDLPTAPPQGLYVNTIYVNDNVAPELQTAVDSATQGDAIMIGAGSYGGATLTITGKQNIALIAPYRANGQTITELAARGLTIAPNCTGSISVNNLQIEGLLTLGGTGNYYIQNVQALAGITIAAGTTGNFFFQNCEVAGLITVPNTFGGAIVFGQSNMTGATYSLNNVSPLQVQIALCTGLPTSRPTNATYGSTNSDTALTITTDTSILKVGGSAGTAAQVLTSQGAGLPTIWADAPAGGGITAVNGTSSLITTDTVDGVVSITPNNLISENITGGINFITNNSAIINPSENGIVFGNSLDDGEFPAAYPAMRTFFSQPVGSFQNVVMGAYSMVVPTSQTTPNTNNVAVGVLTLFPNATTGNFSITRNVAIGTQALGAFNGTNCFDNTVIGVAAGYLGTGIQRTLIGRNAGRTGGTNDGSTCIGHECGNGMAQTASAVVGAFAGRSMVGTRNTVLGYDVGLACAGQTNIYIGSVGCYRINGSNNIMIGHGIQANATTATINNRFQVGSPVNPNYLSGTISGIATENTLVMTGTATLGDIALTNGTLSPTAGGSSGQHLRININGTFYKIALLQD